MSNYLIFDASPIISLTTNNLLWLLKELNKRYDGKFLIPLQVKHELIDVPLMTKRFKFEALQVMQVIRQGVLNVYDNVEMQHESLELMSLANRCFSGRNNFIKIVHLGEMQVIAAAILTNSNVVVIDEICTRLLLEEPLKLTEIMSKRLKTTIKVNNDNLKEFRNKVKGIKTLRSVELVIRAYEFGLLDELIPRKTDIVPYPKRTLLTSLLWGLKIRGCGLSRKELDEIIELEV